MKKIILSLFLLIQLLCFAQSDIVKNEQQKIVSQFTNYLYKDNGDSAYRLIDSIVNKKYTPSYLKFTWKTLISQYGKFKKATPLPIYNSINHQVYYQDLKFKKKNLTLKLSFTNTKLTGVYFIPEDASKKYTSPTYDKRNYTETDVILNSTDKIKLPGILTVPNDVNKPPVVILVHGSGPSNKDEEILSNKPFKDIAIGLAALGIATLRYEKRTLEYMDEMAANADSITIYDETINDAVAAALFLAKRKDVDTNKIVVIGHSLGAMCAPKIALLSNHIKTAIIMAGNARPLEDLIIEQVGTLLKQDSTNFKLKMTLNQIKYQVGVLHSDTFSLHTKKMYLPLGVSAKYWLSLKQYNQVDIAKNLNKPILFLQGERDYQVTMTDFSIWQKNVVDKNVKFISYKKLNHLFMEGKGISKPSEYEKLSHVAFYVIEDISKWIFSLK